MLDAVLTPTATATAVTPLTPTVPPVPTVPTTATTVPPATDPARIIGFDFGLRRIGVAAGNTATGTSAPLTTVTAADGAPDWATVEQLINTWSPATLVVGLPLNMDGSDSTMTVRARRFAESLRRRLKLPVALVDERLTTAAADATLADAGVKIKKRAQHRDNLAAELIVREYLNQPCSTNAG